MSETKMEPVKDMTALTPSELVRRLRRSEGLWRKGKLILGLSFFNSLTQAADRIEELERALRNLANAADDVGVKYFDTDTVEPLVETLQAATMAARAMITKDHPLPNALGLE